MFQNIFRELGAWVLSCRQICMGAQSGRLHPAQLWIPFLNAYIQTDRHTHIHFFHFQFSWLSALCRVLFSSLVSSDNLWLLNRKTVSPDAFRWSSLYFADLRREAFRTCLLIFRFLWTSFWQLYSSHLLIFLHLMLYSDPMVMLLTSHNQCFLMYVKVKVHREKLQHVPFQGWESVKMMSNYVSRIGRADCE